MFNRSHLMAGALSLSLLAQTAAAQTTSTYPTDPFTDVPKSHANYDAIEYLRENKVLKGYVDGTFQADRRISRAEFVKMITNPFILDTARLSDCMRENIRDEDETVFFSDVRRDMWFAAEVCHAKVNDIIDGYPDGSFKPGDYINFVEGAKIMANVFAFQTETDPHDERWYVPYVNALAERKAIPTTVSSADEYMTRGEMAEILYRLKADITNKSSRTAGQIK